MATILMPTAKVYAIKQCWTVWAGSCLLPACVLVVWCLPENFWSALPFELCLIKLLTGHECWGCGSLRGFSHLAHGHFAAAWASNPLVYFWLGAGIGMTAWCWWQIWKERDA